MDPVSNVDQIVLVLRQRLLERSRTTSASSKGRRGAVQGPQSNSLAKAKALASVEGVDDRQLRRTLIQNILSDQLGPDLVNEAKFQLVVDRVAETLEEDAHASMLLARLVADLRL